LLKSASLHKSVQADISLQMERLLGFRFMSLIPLQWLKHYPRYLKAIEYRLDKYQVNVTKDEENKRLINEFQLRLAQEGPNSSEFESKFRWMIEELRVSLFAQALGTSLPVSGKRLEKEWKKGSIE